MWGFDRFVFSWTLTTLSWRTFSNESTAPESQPPLHLLPQWKQMRWLIHDEMNLTWNHCFEVTSGPMQLAQRLKWQTCSYIKDRCNGLASLMWLTYHSAWLEVRLSRSSFCFSWPLVAPHLKQHTGILMEVSGNDQQPESDYFFFCRKVDAREKHNNTH